MLLAVLLSTAVIYLLLPGLRMLKDEVQLGLIALFEDNAEFGLGFRVSIDKQTEFARELLQK